MIREARLAWSRLLIAYHLWRTARAIDRWINAVERQKRG